MFLGNLSTATERTARKTTSAKQQKTKSGDDFTVETKLETTFLDELLFSSDEHMIVISPVPGSYGSRISLKDRIDNSIVYSPDLNTDIPRDILLNYLKDCSYIILQESNIRDIIADSQNMDVGLQEAAVVYQQDVLEFNYHIERQFGCQYLSRIPIMFPTDTELQQAASDYIYSAMRSYLTALNIRCKKQRAEGKKLITSGEFRRINMLEFFEACNTLNAMKETKILLRSLYMSTNKIPNEKVIALQRSLLEVIGYDADFAVSKLNLVQSTYGNDSEILTKMQYFAVSAQTACRESVMDDETKKAFYAQMPTLMHHYPQLFIIQQQQQQQMMMQQQQRMADATGATNVFKSEEGMKKVKVLVERMQRAMNAIDDRDVSSWSAEQREDYFEKFNSHPVLDVLEDAGSDATSRITKLFNLSESDLQDIMTMQAVMSEDVKVKGNISKKIREAQVEMWSAAAKASKEGGNVLPTAVGSSLQKIGGLMASLGSLTNFGRGMEYRGDAEHDHKLSHAGHDCAIHNKTITPDVSSGKADKMIR